MTSLQNSFCEPARNLAFSGTMPFEIQRMSSEMTLTGNRLLVSDLGTRGKNGQMYMGGGEQIPPSIP